MSCAGCQVAVEQSTSTFTEARAGEVRDAVHSYDDFLERFAHREHAQLSWTASKGGTSQPPKLPYCC